VPGDYRPYVQNTAISWEIDVPTFGEIAARIGALRATHDWLVLERDDQIIGFAYGQPLKRLAAFQWATETGMSTSPITSAGGGRELYTQLLRPLTERGYRQGFAGITQQRLSSILRVMRRGLLDTAGQDGPVGPTISSAAGGIRAAKNP
jgi:L-amino acid N-acyltransferase YncA